MTTSPEGPRMLKGLRPVAVERLRRFTHHVPPALSRRVKARAEIFYWKAELERYVRWYGGEALHGYPPPAPAQRVTGHGARVDAAMTWLDVVQKPRYLEALALAPDALAGRRVLDLGCGPFPNIAVYTGADVHGVDPLVSRYRTAGYPIDLWQASGFTYHQAPAERMPFTDGHFDAVVSVNALDHVDDFGAVAHEIGRVLRPGGMLRMQVNYHAPTVTEPVAIDDDAMREHFGWASGLEKLRDEPHPDAHSERLTLWAAG